MEKSLLWAMEVSSFFGDISHEPNHIYLRFLRIAALHLLALPNAWAHGCPTMPRLSVLVSGCSVLLVLAWLLLVTGRNVERENDNDPAMLRGREHTGNHNNSPSGEGVGLGIEVQAVGEEASRQMQGKKKRPVKGVVVNRREIIEHVTLDDLRAPEGRLWIPAAMLGPLSPTSPDPLYNVLVAYCLLDMASYHAKPWLFAMGTFHQKQSGCLSDKTLVRTYRLSHLAVRLNIHTSKYFHVQRLS